MVALVNTLVGAIVAFVGGIQLRRLGAEIYVSNLIGVTVVREMAPLITAIVMSGRTGSAYAAEIAAMQGSGEIDALRALGVPVFDYLILPRVTALTVMMPLLCTYAGALGMLGGFAVAVDMMHITAGAFVTHLRAAVAGTDIFLGLAKSVVFGSWVAIDELSNRHESRPQCDGCWPCGDHGRGERHRRRHCARCAIGRVRQCAGNLSQMNQTGNSPILKVHGLAFGYGTERLQHDVSFDVKRGSIFAIMGASGSGKSTLLKVLIGLLRPSAGQIFFAGVNYCSLDDASRADIGRHFGVLFQGGALWSSMTAAENVALPLEMFTRAR